MNRPHSKLSAVGLEFFLVSSRGILCQAGRIPTRSRHPIAYDELVKQSHRRMRDQKRPSDGDEAIADLAPSRKLVRIH